eukprot:scaffold19455_cov129-Isochrysis_galbana.AAC.1
MEGIGWGGGGVRWRLRIRPACTFNLQICRRPSCLLRQPPHPPKLRRPNIPFDGWHRSLKTYIINSPDLNFDTDTIYAEALLGAAGGLIGSVASTPADVLVTRIITQARSDTPLGVVALYTRLLTRPSLPLVIFQLPMPQPSPGRPLSPQSPQPDGTRMGTLDMFKKILKEEGPAGFLTGLGARALYWYAAPPPPPCARPHFMVSTSMPGRPCDGVAALREQCAAAHLGKVNPPMSSPICVLCFAGHQPLAFSSRSTAPSGNSASISALGSKTCNPPDGAIVAPRAWRCLLLPDNSW